MEKHFQVLFRRQILVFHRMKTFFDLRVKEKTQENDDNEQLGKIQLENVNVLRSLGSWKNIVKTGHRALNSHAFEEPQANADKTFSTARAFMSIVI